MRHDAHVPVDVKVERPLLVWQPAAGDPVEYEVWPERPMTIGRDATNTVVIDSPFISKAHAVIRYSGGEFTVEDLKSANGTRVNGAPILVSVLAPGDILEVGDQRFTFADGAAAESGRSRGLSKNAKLALVAVGTIGVVGTLMAMVVSSGSTPAAVTAGTRTSASSGKVTAKAAEPGVDTKSQAVRDALESARQAGIKPADALFDQANTFLAAGRLREATQLFGAALERDPKNESVVQRFAESKSAWTQAIADHAAEAERAADELRLNDAVLEWGQVLLLTDAADPRHIAAEHGIEDARKRQAR